MARILVIDDDKSLRSMIRLALARSGHEVQSVEDGSRGLAAYGDGGAWDLVLVDQRMPGMEGLEVIREIRQRDPSARIVMMTAFDTVQLATEALAGGAYDFLRKPFSTDLLRGAVTSALRQARTAGRELAESTPLTTEVGGMPRVRSFINGYFFWSVAAPEKPSPSPSDVEIRRAFRVETPAGWRADVDVGVMPHVREQVRAGAGQDYAPEDPLWDMVCRVAVTKLLWEQGEMPPSFLPVYDLDSSLMEDIQKRIGSRPFPGF